MAKYSRRQFIKFGGGVLAMGTLAAVGLLGCSNNSGKPVLRVGYLPITDHLTIIAHDQTEYTSVHIQPVKFASWPALAEALKTGAIEAGFTLTPIGLKLRQDGVPIKAVALGHRNGSAITVKNDDSIQTVEDLTGHKIAIPSPFSTHNIIIRKILDERGIDAEKKVVLIDMAPPEMVSALANGQIDGFVVAEPFGGQAELQGTGRVLMLSKDIWPDHICCVLNVREEALKANPEGVQELVQSMVAAGKFIEGNSEEAARLSVNYLGQRPEVIQYVLENPTDRVTFDNLRPEVKDFSDTQDLMLRFGIAASKVNLNQYLDLRFF
ncbi:MAG: ABC transporter substrate-binding protein [Thermoanaerobacteraceae bacterium]|nr:ABC transporter substrate-binding protein [Thermoanaerobacteraceae bacterium]